MTRFEEIKDYLSERDDADEIILFTSPSYDTAILGISSDGNVIYSYNKMIDYLIESDEMSEEEAMEFIDYNTIRAIDYISDKKKPIICYDDFLGT